MKAKSFTKSTFNPLGENRHLDAGVLSATLGKPVVLRKITPHTVRRFKSALMEAFLLKGYDLIIKCAHRELRWGKDRLEANGVVLDWETYIAAVYSMCWNPNKSTKGKRRFSSYDPMRMSVTLWVRKCVNEAVSEMVHATYKMLLVDGVRTKFALQTSSYEEMVEGGFDLSTEDSASGDFRDSIRLTDATSWDELERIVEANSAA